MPSKISKVSIVMPLYNKERELERAIRSVFAQTVDDYELIVVNDGSTDRGPEIVSGIKDHRIRIIHQANGGVSAARNRGIEEARSDLIAFFDADDEWKPHFLETITRLQSRFPTSSVFATNYLYRNVNGFLMPTIMRGLPSGEWEGIIENYFKVASRSDPPLCSSAVTIRKVAMESVGGFPVGITVGEDLLTWAKLAFKFKIAYSTQPSAIFHLRESLWGNPIRLPDSVDIVGQELERILKNGGKGKISGLEEYIAHWHQMRASVFLRLGKRKEAIYEVKEIAKYSKENMKLYFYFVLALLPRGMCNCAFRTANRLKYTRRRITIPKNTINILK